MTPAALQRTADVRLYRGMPQRCFPPPWSVEELGECFIVRGANGQVLFRGRARSAAKLLTRDETRRIAANIAKLPERLSLRLRPHHRRRDLAAAPCCRWRAGYTGHAQKRISNSRNGNATASVADVWTRCPAQCGRRGKLSRRWKGPACRSLGPAIRFKGR
jgi:hypothetical protein